MKKDWILFISGSRKFTPLKNREWRMVVEYELRSLVAERGVPSLIIHGDANGADKEVTQIFQELFDGSVQFSTDPQNYSILTFQADWEKNGRGAGFMRNEEMGRHLSLLSSHNDIVALVFYDPSPSESKGTKHMMNVLEKCLGDNFTPVYNAVKL